MLLELLKEMPRMTRDRIQDLALQNAAHNKPSLDRGRSLPKLCGQPLGEDDSAIVVARGPSIHRFHPVENLKAANYRGSIIATESAIAYCLRHGVVPHLVVSADPHANRIGRWLGTQISLSRP